MFANLNQGSLVYVLNLKDGLKYNVGTVQSVANPNVNNNLYQPFNTQNREMPITITVNINGESVLMGGITPNTSFTKTNEYILTDSKEVMVNQVEGILQTNKDILDNIDVYKENIESCNNILKQISPQYAKESTRDNAIADLYNKMEGLGGKIDSILNALNANNKTE